MLVKSCLVLCIVFLVNLVQCSLVRYNLCCVVLCIVLCGGSCLNWSPDLVTARSGSQGRSKRQSLPNWQLFFIYFQLGSRAPHTVFGLEKSDKIAQNPPIFGSAITIHVMKDCSSDLRSRNRTRQSIVKFIICNIASEQSSPIAGVEFPMKGHGGGGGGGWEGCASGASQNLVRLWSITKQTTDSPSYKH